MEQSNSPIENNPTISEYTQRLKEARDNNDIYAVARLIGVLRGLGIDVEIDEEEKAACLQELEKTRVGNVDDFFRRVPGYMVARWLMILKNFYPEDVEISESDIVLMQSALEQYQNEENYYQIASLKITTESIGVSLDYSKFSQAETAEIERNEEEIIS
ncbi:MAG: hypothetical protein ACK42D_00230 [Candidatus Paceibacteria bacterium]